MTDRDLFDALDGLMAYDVGATDSGIHDDALRGRVTTHLRSLSPDSCRQMADRFARLHYLSDGARGRGYGPEDDIEFRRWLRDDMGAEF
jgi:hypothetical protein